MIHLYRRPHFHVFSRVACRPAYNLPKASVGFLAALCLALPLTGCMAPAYVAMEMEKAGIGRDTDKGRAVLLKHIKALQEKGDPLGDYFYALGNSDGWIEDVKDPQAITGLFRQAAAKGSMDAKILLALQKAGGDAKPANLNVAFEARRDLQQWEQGLAELLPLLQQQCFVRRLLVGDVTLSTRRRPFVEAYSIAYKIWPNFRDGYYRYNPDGSRTLLKDPERYKLWEDIDKGCKEPAVQWLDTLYK